MDKDKTSDQLPPIRLPRKPPDPNGEPVPVRNEALDNRLAALVATGVAVVLGVPVALGMLTPCVGATRSARLFRAERESEIGEELARISQQDKAAAVPLTKPPAEQP